MGGIICIFPPNALGRYNDGSLVNNPNKTTYILGVASSSVSHTSSPARHQPSPAPKRETEVHETRLVIVADDTCAVETPVPVTEHVTITGDATSVVAVTESLAPTSNEKTREVSL